MGNYFTNFFATPVIPLPPNTDTDTDTDTDITPSTRTILINQAYCYGCHSRMVNEGVCKCGNVEVYGHADELGRRIKDEALYSDCSLLEYKKMIVV